MSRPLTDFLCASFTNEELRRFAAQFDPRLPYELPSLPASLREVATELVAWVRRHGVENAFIEALRRERPGQFSELEALTPHPGEPLVFGLPGGRPTHLHGRAADLARIEKALAEGLVVVTGMPGMGKTRLALEVALRARARGTGVVWLRAGNEAELRASLAQLGRWLCPDLIDGSPVPVATVVERLSSLPDLMVVLDNVEDPRSTMAYLPRSGPVLLTARVGSGWAGSGHVHGLRGLNLEEAAQLLQTLSGDPDKDAAGRVAAVLGGLPLALRQAAAWCEQGGRRLSDLALRLEQRGVASLPRAGVPLDYPESAVEVFRLSYAELAQREPNAAAIVRLLAALAPAPLPRSVLEGRTPEAGCLSFLRDEDLVDDAIRAATQAALIETRPGELEMHPFVMQLVREETADPPTRDWAHLMIATVLNSAVVRAAELEAGGTLLQEAWARPSVLFPHALAASLTCSPAALSDGALQAAAAHVEDQLQVTGEYESASALAAHLTAVSELAFGPTSPATRRWLHNQGVMEQHCGRFQRALSLVEAAAERFAAAGDSDALEKARLDHNLGYLYMMTGAHERALPLLKQVLQGRTSLVGSADPSVANTHESLGTWWLTAGDARKAAEHMQAAHLIRCAIHPADHPTRVRTTANYSTALLHAGRVEDAHTVVDTMLRSVSPRLRAHPVFVALMQAAADVAAARGDLEQARSYLVEAIAAAKLVDVGSRWVIELSAAQLATMAADWRAAEGNWRAALAGSRTEAPRPSVELAMVEGLALSLEWQGRGEEAVGLWARALDLRWPAQDVHQLAALADEAYQLYREGRLLEAEPLYRALRSAYHRTGNAVRCAQWTNGLAFVLLNLGRSAEAKDMFLELIASLEFKVDAGSRAVMTEALTNLARVHADSEDLPGALETLNRALGSAAGQPSVALKGFVRLNLAVILERLGSQELARSEAAQAEQELCAEEGHEHWRRMAARIASGVVAPSEGM